MQISITQKKLSQETLENALIKELRKNEKTFHLEHAVLFNEFPVYKDLDEDIVIAQILIISSKHGIILFHVDNSTSEQELTEKLEGIENDLDNLYSILFTRTLRNKRLRKTKKELSFPVLSVIYAPLCKSTKCYGNQDFIFCQNSHDLENFFDKNTISELDPLLYSEIKSTLEGSKALIKNKSRDGVQKNSKGDAVNLLEKEIASFDQFQRSAHASIINGVNRIRGLAGSGKTIALAIKAALTHLKYPDARIAYTYHTRSLHQHIKRLVTRFYRQFEDIDPNWDNLEIVNSWGSSSNPGIYYNACKANEISPLSFSFAYKKSSNAFDYACNDFLSQRHNVQKLYDYIFIDEGQDFPPSFLKLCLSICKNQRILWAYDELQTIFLPKSPSAGDIFGINEKGVPKIDFEEDIILYKCYRNPREIILVAHAIGFGIYGNRIVQMIESEEYWNDIGYDIKSGKLQKGELLKIERPKENSLESISTKYDIDEIIRIEKYESYSKELYGVAKEINGDIKDGLLHEDILVITVDDRNASKYLSDLQEILSTKYKIKTNNIHADKYSFKDFQIDGKVTLSTVHKAKGNEAYSIYIVGAETLFSVDPTTRERNIFFTAMTRSKGWVHISGIGNSMDLLINETNEAKRNFPYLKFEYPSPGDLVIMKRDIKEKAIRKSKSKRMIEDALVNLTPEEIKRYVDQISEKKEREK